MVVVALGLTSAIIFGAADFFGGLAARKISALTVTGVGAATGLVILGAGTTVVKGTWSWNAVLLGGLSGVAGAIAISLLYACLARGPMSILAPTMAVVSAIVPTAAGAVRGEQLRPLTYLAAVLVLAAAALVGFVPERSVVRPSARALLMAVGSGTMIGTFLIIMDLTPEDSGLVPLVANRGANVIVMAVAVGFSARGARRRSALVQPSALRYGWRAGLAFAVVAGGIDAVANSLMLVGLRLGSLTVMSVLIALSPAGTAILAGVALGERVSRSQYVGIGVAITGAALFAVP